MLKQLSRAAAAAAVMALAPLSTAKAVCTSGSFTFCFDFTFSSTGATVTYQSGTGTLTAFGISGYTGLASTSVGAVTASSADRTMFGSSNIIDVTLIARRPWGVSFSAAGMASIIDLAIAHVSG